MQNTNSVRWGALLGAGTVLLFLAAYLIGPLVMLHPGLWWGSLLPYVYVMHRQMSRVEGADIRERLKVGFVIFVVANAVFFVFYHLLFTYFDPQLVALQEEQLLASPLYTGKPEELDLTPTLGSTVYQYCSGLIGGFIIAFVMAYIINRRLDQ